MDAAAEMTIELSVYHYAGNNPANLNDPMGDYYSSGSSYTSYDYVRNKVRWGEPGMGAEVNQTIYQQYLANDFFGRFGEGGGGGEPFRSLHHELFNLRSGGNTVNGFSVLNDRIRISFSYWIDDGRREGDFLHHIDDQLVLGTMWVFLDQAGNFSGISASMENLWSTLGIGVTLGEALGFKKGEWWFSFKQMKFYDWKAPGNKYTGGKWKHSGAINTKLKWAGRGLAAYSIFNTTSDWRKGEISTTRMVIDNFVTGLTTRYPQLWTVAVGWEAGRIITSISWYRRNIRPWLQEKLQFGMDDESKGYMRDKKLNYLFPD